MSTDTRSHYIQRIQKLDKLSSKLELQKLELEMCRRDPVHFINNWGFTFDPRNNPKHFPFILYPYQVESIKWFEERYKKKENGLVEKSRDLGVSYLAVAWAVHHFIFDKGFTVLFGSRKESLVDNFTIDSLFGKIRYFLYRLPKFFLPKNLSEGSKWDRHMSITNPENGNQISGESTNSNFGRGGRSSVCFIDEAAHIEHSEQIYAAISENSDSVISLSTPNGKSNQFAWLRFETDIPRLSLHWSSHPHKNQEWYEKKKSQLKPWQVASELDLSYERSLEGRVYQRFDRAYHVPRETIKCNLEYEQFIALDFGIADPTAILWGQVTTDGFVEIWNCFEMAGFDIDFYIPIMRGFTPKEFDLLSPEDKQLVLKALAKVPKNHKADNYGDHAGTARTANSIRSCRDAIKEATGNFKSSGKQTFDWRIECVENLMKLRFNATREQWYSIFRVSPDCERLIECLFNYVYDSDDVSDNKLKPKHNQFSHMVTALEFFTISRFPVVNKLIQARDQRIR